MGWEADVLKVEERWRRDHQSEPATKESDEEPTTVEPLTREEVRELLAKRHKKEEGAK